jgi:hypothetical protein
MRGSMRSLGGELWEVLNYLFVFSAGNKLILKIEYHITRSLDSLQVPSGYYIRTTV